MSSNIFSNLEISIAKCFVFCKYKICGWIFHFLVWLLLISLASHPDDRNAKICKFWQQKMLVGGFRHIHQLVHSKTSSWLPAVYSVVYAMLYDFIFCRSFVKYLLSEIFQSTHNRCWVIAGFTKDVSKTILILSQLSHFFLNTPGSSVQE